jgi:hypothetical protein
MSTNYWNLSPTTFRKRVNLKTFAAMLFLTVLSSGCASSLPPLPPRLEERSLRISPDRAGFEYQYEVCVRKNIFGGCRETKWQIDYYDLSDDATRKMLIHMGFVGRVREKFIP